MRNQKNNKIARMIISSPKLMRIKILFITIISMILIKTILNHPQSIWRTDLTKRKKIFKI